MSANQSAVLREHAEQLYAEELATLAEHDKRQRPPNWALSPWAVAMYLLGGELGSFEQEYAAYCGAKHCVRSDFDALYLGLRAWKPVPPHLFGAYLDLGQRQGADPIAEEQS